MVPSTEPCALRSTQPLKESTRDFSRSKGGRCIWLTIYHPCSAETSRKSGALIYPEPLGATSACRGMTFTLPYLLLPVAVCQILYKFLYIFVKCLPSTPPPKYRSLTPTPPHCSHFTRHVVYQFSPEDYFHRTGKYSTAVST